MIGHLRLYFANKMNKNSMSFCCLLGSGCTQDTLESRGYKEYGALVYLGVAVLNEKANTSTIA